MRDQSWMYSKSSSSSTTSMNRAPTDPARWRVLDSICSISLRKRRMFLDETGESVTRVPSFSSMTLPKVSSIRAFTNRAADSLMNSVRAGSNGTGRSTCPARVGRDRRSFAMTSMIFRVGVTTVSRIPERRAAVDKISPRPRMFEASNITMSPGRRPRRAISTSTFEARISRSFSLRFSLLRSLCAFSSKDNSLRRFSRVASDVTTSRSAWN